MSKDDLSTKFTSSFFNRFGGVLFITLFAVIGVYLLTTGHAASPYVSLNADQGSLANSATIISNSGATDGKYVQFGTSGGGGGGGGHKFIISVNNTLGYGTASNEPLVLLKNIGVTWTRNDYSSGYVSGARNAGINVLPIYDSGPDGNCNDESAAQVGAGVRAAIPTLQSNGIKALEICNESYFTEHDTTYAAQYDAAHQALAGTGIKALAVATGLATSCAADSNPNWIGDVIHALPGGAGEVDGWTIHPYGALSGDGSSGCSSGSTNYGWANDVPNWHTIAVNNGSNAPWYVTEVGQCLGGGGSCHSPDTQQQQADAMTQYLNDIATKYTWVVYFNWYASCDDSSGDYGIINREGGQTGVCDAGPRQVYTALQTWIQQHPGNVQE